MCEDFCTSSYSTDDWATKCEWDGCQGCEQCSSDNTRTEDGTTSTSSSCEGAEIGTIVADKGSGTYRRSEDMVNGFPVFDSADNTFSFMCRGKWRIARSDMHRAAFVADDQSRDCGLSAMATAKTSADSPLTSTWSYRGTTTTPVCGASDRTLTEP